MGNLKGNKNYPAAREDHLLAEYGLTLDAYSALLESQNFGCKICKKPNTDKARRNLSVDHDHKTGRVRGLLCGACNKLIGLANDNPTILLKAIQYLKGNL